MKGADRFSHLELALAGVVALPVAAFFFYRQSFIVALIACAFSAGVAGFLLGRHLAERVRSSREPSLSGGEAIPPRLQGTPAPKETLTIKAKEKKEVPASEIARRLRGNLARGIPTALVVLEFAPISDRARSLSRELLQESALQTLRIGLRDSDRVCALEGRRLLMLIEADEAGAVQLLQRLYRLLWRRARVASKAGIAVAPRDGGAFITLLHRARKRAAAARYVAPPPGMVRPPLPLGQKFSERL